MSPTQPTRAPLLYVLLPCMGGYALGAHTGASPTGQIALSAAALLLGVLAWVSLKSPRNPLMLWGLFFCISTMLLSWAYFSARQTPRPEHWASLPPREAELTLRVFHPFNSADKFGRLSGLAHITNTPEHLTDLRGQRVVYHLIPETADTPALHRGSVFEARGELRFAEDFWRKDDPTRAGFHAYLARQGVYFSLSRGYITQTLPSTALPWQRTAQRLNTALSQNLLAGLSGEHAAYGIFPALVLGNKTHLSPAQKERFVQSGTMHLFAVSGLHVGTVAGLCFALCRLLRLPRAAGAVLGLGLTYAYVEIVGAPPSALRAFNMVAFLWAAYALKRQHSAFAALVASALFVLVLDPHTLFSPGFQLSYTVVSAILLCGVPLAQWWEAYWEPEHLIPQGTRAWRIRTQGKLGRWLGQGLIICTVTTVASSPLVAHYFGVFTPGAVLLNLCLLPTVGLLLATGLTSGLGGLAWGAFSVGLNRLSAEPIAAMQWVLDHSRARSDGVLFINEVQLSGVWAVGLTLLTIVTLGILGHYCPKATSN